MSKPSNKVTAKFNSHIRQALATASNQASKFSAFDHFSYQVDWSNFPNSLMIDCHLADQPTLIEPMMLEEKLAKILQINLLKQGIKFRDIRNNIKIITPS